MQKNVAQDPMSIHQLLQVEINPMAHVASVDSEHLKHLVWLVAIHKDQTQDLISIH